MIRSPVASFMPRGKEGYEKEGCWGMECGKKLLARGVMQGNVFFPLTGLAVVSFL